jgi:hypothetical protein
MRWVDARLALIFPDARHARVVIPASTPPHTEFTQAINLLTSVPLRPDDLDPGFSLYELDRTRFEALAGDRVVDFDGAVSLVHSHWLAQSLLPGQTAEFLMVWRIIRPDRVGPLVPPLETTDAVIFTQVLSETGTVLAQRDSLEAPSWDWQPGDLLVQIHPITIPTETAPGTYRTIVGLYDRLSGDRLTTRDEDGLIGDSYATVEPLQVGDS